MYVGACVYATAPMWQPEDNLVKFILSFHLFVGYRDQIQVIRLVCQALYQLSHLSGPLNIFS